MSSGSSNLPVQVCQCLEYEHRIFSCHRQGAAWQVMNLAEATAASEYDPGPALPEPEPNHVIPFSEVLARSVPGS